MERRIIQTGITNEVLGGGNRPQLQIGDKLYEVDDRQSTFDNIQKLKEDETIDEATKSDKIFELTLGASAAKEIKEMDLPVQNYIYLTYCVMGAITGEDPSVIQDRVKKLKN
jgi:hypothetical protein